ncbi:MAG TPA: corrinoid protein [Bacillota bacterium]|jgi:5-methyltetrahydrofolate--homocysteine methyltransferase|nr:corrinoid protein [Bacillota bacterium]
MLAAITEAVRDGNTYDIEELIQSRLDAGDDPFDLLRAMMEGLEQCGRKFEAGEYFLPELIMASDAFTSGMKVLEPHLGEASPMGQEGRVLLGTVAGDVHDIGKNLVGFLLKSAGFEVIDLGTDVSTAAFIEAVKKYEPDVLGLSALLTTTMLGMEDVIKAMDAEGLRERTKVIIGGGPVSARFAEQIRADAYASDAAEGVRKVRELVAK